MKSSANCHCRSCMPAASAAIEPAVTGLGPSGKCLRIMFASPVRTYSSISGSTTSRW